jgi:hypothetical protein
MGRAANQTKGSRRARESSARGFFVVAAKQAAAADERPRLQRAKDDGLPSAINAIMKCRGWNAGR